MQESKNQQIQEFKRQASVLREETGSGTEVVVRIANIPRVEPDPATDEDPERRPRKAAIGSRRKFIPRTIHVEFFPANKAFGMNQDDGTDSKTSETEFVGREDFTSTTSGTATVAHSQLSGNNQDVAFLFLFDQLDRFGCANVTRR